MSSRDSGRQLTRLTRLHVALHRMNASLDPGEVLATIADLTIHLLGAESFVVLLRSPGAPDLEVALGHGAAARAEPFASGRYRGGDALIDSTLSRGGRRRGPIDGSAAIAVIPLVLDGGIVGALAILRLFDHRRVEDDDSDLLDLLSAHAARSLVLARLYQANR